MWSMLGTSWAHVEPMLAYVRRMLAYVGLGWAYVGPMLAYVGPMLAYVGSMLSHLGGYVGHMLGICWLSWAYVGERQASDRPPRGRGQPQCTCTHAFGSAWKGSARLGQLLHPAVSQAPPRLGFGYRPGSADTINNLDKESTHVSESAELYELSKRG